MNRSDSKYFNTSVKIDEAFFELLDKKAFEYITVKELCALAGVNRSTFYLHYETINDLLLETVEYIYRRFSAYFEQSLKAEDIISAPKEELMFITSEYLTPWLNFISDNKKLYETVLKRCSIFNPKATFEHMLQKVIYPILSRFGIPDENKSYILTFYLEGLNGIVKEWLKEDCKRDIADIVKLITSCVIAK